MHEIYLLNSTYKYNVYECHFVYYSQHMLIAHNLIVNNIFTRNISIVMMRQHVRKTTSTECNFLFNFFHDHIDNKTTDSRLLNPITQ